MLGAALTAFLVLSTNPAQAQSPAPRDRLSVDSLLASLQSSTSVADLRKREFALAKPPASNNAESILERGTVVLRIYQLSQTGKDADLAREIFQKAVKKAPEDARTWYGLGLAYYGVTDGRQGGPAFLQAAAEAVGSDPRSRAGRAFQRALELDPSLQGAALHMARLAVEKHDRDLLVTSRDALERLIAMGVKTSEVATALSKTEAALGDVDAAASAAQLALDAHTGDASANQLARAVALFRKKGEEERAAEAYFAGIDALTQDGARAYFRDLQAVTTPEEVRAWESKTLEERKTWLRGFWDMRAAMAGVTVGERVSEHYRRMAEATQRYRRLGKRGAAPSNVIFANTYNEGALPYDERGLIYIRHGKPMQVIRTSSPDLRPNESWVYRQPNGEFQMFNFVVMRDGTDYRLVDDLFSAMDPSGRDLPYDALIDMFKDRGSYEPRYFQLATRLSQVRHQAWAASAFEAVGATGGAASMSEGSMNAMTDIGTQRRLIAENNREAAREAIVTDSDTPDFSRDLPFYYDVFSMKGHGASTAVTAAVAVPGSSLKAEPIAGGYAYRVQLSLILIDTATQQITRSDTAIAVRSGRVLGQNDYLRLYTGLETDIARQVVHRVIVKDLVSEAGQLYGGDTNIRAFVPTGLQISDIVMAEPEAGTWKRGPSSLGLVPPRQFMQGAPVRLFYELYNLPAGARYRTEIAIEPYDKGGLSGLKKLFGGKDGIIRFSFDGEAAPGPDGIAQESRRVSSEIKPGRYRVRVKVTNLASNEVTNGETSFVVLDRK